MSSGYGADRGSKPLQIRSGVFRGALSVLLPLVDRYSDDVEDENPLALLGAERMRATLTKRKYLPLP